MNALAKKPSGSIYVEYMESLKNTTDALKYKEANYYLKQFNLLNNIINALPCAVYILDYRTQQYLYISDGLKKLLGYTPDEYYAGGQALQRTRVHPDDLAVFAGKIFLQFLDYSRNMPKEDLSKTRFSLNIRVRRKDDVYIHMFQQYVILERDETNNPILTLGIATDISAHKKDDSLAFSVSRYDEETGFRIMSMSENTAIQNFTISSRECEVINYLIQGLSSKQIADKLYISEYTVRAHRRNILEKTGCKNTVQLSSYAISKGLI